MPEGTINFLNAKELSGVISRIEQNFPGFWYSVYQNVEGVQIRLAPSPHCLFDADRAWSMTKEGDEGHELKIPYVATSFYENIKHAIEIHQTFVKGVRDKITNEGTKFPPYVGRARRQEKADLESLQKNYKIFLNNVPIYYSNGVVIREFHLSSCQLTVDCSIRGTFKDGSEMDIMYDCPGNAILAHSLGHATNELNEMSTPKAA